MLKTKNAYICLSLITLAAATLALLISNGSLFQVFFFMDPDDTGMDFFNSIVETSTRRPYEQYDVLYPPLANLFFYLLTLFIPNDIKAGWPDSHEGVKFMVGDREDLRLMQSAMVLFLIFLLITLFIMAKMIHARTGSYLLTFCLVFSAGTLAAIERGNVILLAFILTFYFVEHYKDENRLTSELALLALAAAFGFKLYPCIFGLLLIKDRKWAAAGRCILYAVLFTVLPTFVFEGPKAISLWLDLIIGFGGFSAGTTSTSGLTTASEGTIISSVSFSWILVAVLGALLLIIFLVRKSGKPLLQLRDSQILFLVTYLTLLTGGGSGGYNLLFFIIPFLSFLSETDKLNYRNCIEFLLYLVCLLPVGINEFNVYFLVVYIIGVLIRNIKQKGGQLRT